MKELAEPLKNQVRYRALSDAILMALGGGVKTLYGQQQMPIAIRRGSGAPWPLINEGKLLLDGDPQASARYATNWKVEKLIAAIEERPLSHRLKCPWCSEPSFWIKDDGSTFCFHCGLQPSLEELAAKLRRSDQLASQDPVVVALIWRLDLPPSTLADIKF